MTPHYDVCFAGEILEGQDPALVRARLAKLFKADDKTLERLFSGKTQVIKRNCDRDTALKYKKAIEQSGARPIVRAAALEPSATAPEPTPPAPPPEQPKTLTAAERIALLAGAPDVTPTASTPPAPQAEESAASSAPADGDIQLAPSGTDVLREDERTTVAPVAVDVSGIELMAPGSDLAPPADAPPPAPQTNHLSMGEVGETIPTLDTGEPPINPDITGISLAAADGDLSDCAPPEAPAPDLDLSAINLAPDGADMLDPAYRKEVAASAPATDHLSLED